MKIMSYINYFSLFFCPSLLCTDTILKIETPDRNEYESYKMTQLLLYKKKKKKKINRRKRRNNINTDINIY